MILALFIFMLLGFAGLGALTLAVGAALYRHLEALTRQVTDQHVEVTDSLDDTAWFHVATREEVLKQVKAEGKMGRSLLSLYMEGRDDLEGIYPHFGIQLTRPKSKFETELLTQAGQMLFPSENAGQGDAK
jgi:hypothetical protein